MSRISTHTALDDAIAFVTKVAHQTVADAELRSRAEVAKAVEETKEARVQRDKALKDYCVLQKEVQLWKEEANASKAALGQAELTIAHQTDTLTQHLETIAQLQRELDQWKDQSKNWQTHFTRVEQERCTLSSRLEELVSERLQWSRTVAATPSLLNQFTPQSRYPGSNGSGHSSSSNKRRSIPSPTQPVTTKLNPDDDTFITSTKDGGSAKSRRTLPQKQLASTSKLKPARERPNDIPSPTKERESVKRNASLHPTSGQKNGIRQSTVIRRVHAVVTVKREEESDAEQNIDEEESPEVRPAQSRRTSRRIIADDESESEEPPNGQLARSLRPTKPVHYCEEDDEVENGEDEGGETSEEDPLIMGNENRKEVPRIQRSKAEAAGAPAKKRRKTASNVT
ncbi:hypothetical protein FA15DRAFT_754115 [Coprinopsis marcescibilis]|uniref:Uncharacterized protein n=1 Tax=Coprinopsis marcescibilis TaxID=230819 RepID=A0A5C3L4Q6_COPMA|nr:hypothetical protein FA15DRAFT_754115 [Coprinopsis marcescibilis]